MAEDEITRDSIAWSRPLARSSVSASLVRDPVAEVWVFTPSCSSRCYANS
jgi:hypothetical protein